MIETQQITYKAAKAGKRLYTCIKCKMALKTDSDVIEHITEKHSTRKCFTMNCDYEPDLIHDTHNTSMYMHHLLTKHEVKYT